MPEQEHNTIPTFLHHKQSLKRIFEVSSEWMESLHLLLLHNQAWTGRLQMYYTSTANSWLVTQTQNWDHKKTKINTRWHGCISVTEQRAENRAVNEKSSCLWTGAHLPALLLCAAWGTSSSLRKPQTRHCFRPGTDHSSALLSSMLSWVCI